MTETQTTTAPTYTRTPKPPTPTRLTYQRLNAARPKEAAYKITDPAVPGLFILVQPGGTKTFILNFSLRGKRSEVKLGRLTSMTLDEAREAAIAARKLVELGQNPADVRKAQIAALKAEEKKATEPVDDKHTFRAFVEQWKTEKLAGRTQRYLDQIDSRMRRLVLPHIGHKAVAEVTASDVLKIVDGLKVDRPVTSETVRKNIESIYAWAIKLDAIQWGGKIVPPDVQRVEQNPALPLRGHVELPKAVNAIHLEPKQLGTFWRALGRQHGARPSTIAAARLLFLTMVRKGECLRAKWSEFDLDAGIWDIPAERMKMKIAHRVFLSRQAIELLVVQRAVSGNTDYVFPSPFHNNLPVGEATLNHLFKRIDCGVPEFSPHGTRSTTATRLREMGVDPDVIELCLAHGKQGIKAIYQRNKSVPERIAAYQMLADEIDRLSAASNSDVN